MGSSDMNDHLSLPEVLVHHAGTRGAQSAVALTSDAHGVVSELTFAALLREASALAADLSERSPPGERALLVFPTGLEFIVAYLACLIARVVAVPLMLPRKRARADASAAIIADCSPRLVLTPGGDWDGLRPAFLEQLVGQGIVHVPVVVGREDVARSSVKSVECDTLAFLQYTSGSTSSPRGVMVTHGNLLANLTMMQARFGTSAGARHVNWVPHYHDMGLILNLLLPLYCGATSILMPPSGFMHRPLGWLRNISRFGAEAAAAPNFAYDLCVDRFRPEQMEGVDLSGWRLAINAAEPVRTSTLQRFTNCFAPYGFRAEVLRPAYGLAEATLMVSAPAAAAKGPVLKDMSVRALQEREVVEPTADADTASIVCCGVVADGLEIAIVDPDTRQRLAPSRVGEVWIRGASVAQGYWAKSADTQQLFRAAIAGESAPAEGWLRTGDLGHLDAELGLFLLGRLKDLLIIRGVNHYPQDIEATAAESHPALRRDHGAVFTVPDRSGLEKIVLVQEVERTHRHGLDCRLIEAAIRAAVIEAHEISIAKITLIKPGALPKTTSGKVQRFLARQLWLDSEFEAFSLS